MVISRPLLAVVAGLVLSSCASLAPPPAGERGIVVVGTGHVALRPDTGVIDVGVEARAPRLADATAEVDRAMREVVARVKALGVADADVRTTLYSIDPIAEPRQPGQPGDTGVRIVGYRVANVAQVRSRQVDGLGRIVDAAVGAGANVVRNIRFTIDDPSRAEAEARALAVRDAGLRAGQIAAAAGLRLGRLLSATESAAAQPMARMVMTTMAGPVEPGQLDVTVSVEARYAIEP